MKNYYKRIIYLALGFLLSSTPYSSAQTGKMFWFAAPDVTVSHGDDPIALRITAGEIASRVRISMPANPNFTPIFNDIAAFQQISVNTPSGSFTKANIENSPINTVNSKGILVEVVSGGNISCYYEVLRESNPDIFTLKGENALGQEFFIPSQNSSPNHPFQAAGQIQPYEQINIVATEDGTLITVVPSDDLLNSVNKSETLNIALNRGQTYSINARDWATATRSLGGTHITSNKDIAVTISDDSIEEGSVNSTAWDLIGDQIIPTSIIGNEYIAVRATGINISNYNRVFVTSTADNTLINIDGTASVMMNKGEVKSFDFGMSNYSMHIKASAPIYAYQVSGTVNGITNELGSTLLPTIDGCTGSKRVSFTRNFNNGYWIQMLTKQRNIGSFKMYNASRVLQTTISDKLNNPSTWVQVGTSDWYSTSIDLSKSPYLISTGTSYSIENTIGLFHLSVLDENGGSISAGYFSDYYSGAYACEIQGPTQACAGDCIELSATRYDGTFQWESDMIVNLLLSNTSKLIVTQGAKYYLYRDVNVGCIAVDSVEVSFHQPQFTLADPGIVCPNTPITLTLSPQYDYLWSTGETSNSLTISPTKGSITNLSVVGTDMNGCTLTQSVAVVASNADEVSLSSVPSIVSVGDKIEDFSNAVGYEWFLDGNIVPNSNYSHIVASKSGIYKVSGMSIDGCFSSDSKYITVDGVVTNINPSNGSIETFSITPNPTKSVVKVSIPKNVSTYSVEVYSSVGSLLLTAKDSPVIDFSSFAKGVYLIKIITDGGNWTGKAVKE